jgi:glycosyltransferase involved in cell wall biosynthesis
LASHRSFDLTVVVQTYNHAPFVRSALDSVLRQVTDCAYEIVITEDCSTDGTRDIVKRFAEAHPDRVRLLLSERNLNSNYVMRRALQAVRGRYVALLDGDDLWTSGSKLQKQLDFLETHPDCSACFHNVNVVYEDGSVPSHPFHMDAPSQRLTMPLPNRISTLADIVRGNFIQTCSVVLRSESLRRLPKWYDELWLEDWSLYVVAAEHGNIGYLDEILATYRVHAGSVWAAGRSLLQHLDDVEMIAETYDAHNRHLAFRFDAEIRAAVAALYGRAAYSYFEAGEQRWARTCALRALRRSSVRERLARWKLLGVLTLGRRDRLPRLGPVM